MSVGSVQAREQLAMPWHAFARPPVIVKLPMIVPSVVLALQVDPYQAWR